ncbi:hypothetical protein, partial [Mariniradius saccharolyticus]|uniref:hypothetical protein n=1 Tax=Mariniradius saccharolyticus TaxID=1245591 RepID=UPI001B7F93F4
RQPILGTHKVCRFAVFRVNVSIRKKLVHEISSQLRISATLFIIQITLTYRYLEYIINNLLDEKTDVGNVSSKED